MPGPSGILIGAKVSMKKREFSKKLRRNMTPQEKVLWTRLRGNRLDGHHFRRQQVIAGFIIDFYHHASGLAIEVDGRVHDRQRDYDRWRDQILSEHGIRVIRIRNDEVDGSIEDVLARILAACSAERS